MTSTRAYANAVSSQPRVRALNRLTEGQEIPFGADRVAVVSNELAERFTPGDRLIVVQSTGALLLIPASVNKLVADTVADARRAFADLATVTDDQITDFFDRFAEFLDDDERFAPVAEANAADVSSAASRGRSTTRLVLDERMRSDMVRGLRGWRDSSSRRDGIVDRIDHGAWSVEARRAPLGVVGFVFEGRPNVFADACGVVRTGNTVVFRIGSDALATARAIVEHALTPALRDAGLPQGAVRLVDSPTHAAGHALFSDRGIALAVARGSGAAVAELGAVASQSGTPVSLHGTGGAWMVAGHAAAAATLSQSVRHSLDRKVCNTLNVVVVVRDRAAELVPVVLDALDQAASERGALGRLHVVAGSEAAVPAERFGRIVPISRAGGTSDEPAASVLAEDDLADRMGVGAVTRDHTRRGRLGRRCRRTVQSVQPTVCRIDRHRRRGGTRSILGIRRRSIRRQRVHPLGRWSVRPECTRARAVELAVRPDARPWSDPVRRQRSHHPSSSDSGRPLASPLTRGAHFQTPVMSTITWVVALVVTQTEPDPSSFTLAPLATAPESPLKFTFETFDGCPHGTTTR